MPISFRAVGSGLLALIALASAAFGQPQAPPPRVNAGETVNVEVKIVPFYAVDAQGNPVYDLRQDEVELRVGGAPVPVESFDRYVIQGGRAGAAASPLTPTPSRTVFFLFDQTFSSPTGFNTDKRLASRMIQAWPAGDRLLLMVYGTGGGLQKKLGPVPPDAQGKRELLAAIEALEPETRRLELQEDTNDDYGAPAGHASRGNFVYAQPADQRASVDDAIQGSVRGEYHSVARGFAGSLGDFAAELRRISGPKLLVLFSQGPDSALYFQGSTGFKVGSDESVDVDSRRAPPLVDRFRQPLAALAESGTSLLFVNTDRGQDIDADAALRHMAQTTGGLYVEGRDPQSLEKRIAGSTTAYYEASFHPAAPLLERDSAPVEIVVRRPGVRAWAPAAVRTRESYATLSAVQKRWLVIDLLSGGPAAQRAHSPVRLSVQPLPGRVVSQAAFGRPGLRFEAAWPADLATRRLDVYNVLFAPPAEGKKGKVLRFDAREALAAADRAAIDTVVEGDGSLVWGIVAVDPETQQTWLGRLVLKAPEKTAAK
jgi:hypothetical protein